MSLQLQFFSPPAVSVDGVSVSFRSRKSLALLAFLVLEPGRHSRESLTALLWPDSDSERGRATLRRTLALLREELGALAASCLQAERESIAFVPQAAVTCDVDVLAEASRLLSLQPPPADLLERLGATLTAYRGELLAGFSLNDAEDFDTWAATQREHWHRRFSAVLDRLTAEQLAAGVNATDGAARWVAHDPLDETAHRRLMRAHAAVGDRAAALRAYERCRDLLVRELDIEPDPETVALAAQLRDSSLSVAVSAHSDSASRGSDSGSRFSVLGSSASGSRFSVLGSLASPHLLEGPLVGRAAEFATLTEAFSAAAVGRTQVALVTGESGIGKTRLAHELLRWAASQGAAVLHGRALELTSHVPYQPLLDGLRPPLAQAEASLLDADSLAELSRLIPDLRRRWPELPLPTADERLAQSRLFSAVTLLVAQLARRGPLLLLLDDAQWADSATRDLLAYALRAWAADGQPILLLLTARAEDLAMPSHALNGWQAGLRRDLPLARLHLAALSAADTAHFVATLGNAMVATPAGAQPTAEFARFGQQLYAATQGQPLFLLEMLRSLLDQGDLLANQHNGTWQISITPATLNADPSRSPAVRDLIHARLAYLSQPAQRLLLAVAVLGDQADFETLLAVTGMDDETGLNALDEVLQRRFLQLVEGRNGQPERYRFLHDMVREVLSSDAGEARRRVLHRRALEVLSQQQTPAATLAYHAERARQDEALLRYSTLAGDESLALSAAREAIGHYGRARAALERLGSGVSNHGALLLNMGRAHELADEWDAAWACYAALRQAAQAASQLELEVTALTRLALVQAQQRFDTAAALATLTTAAELAQRHGDRMLAAETAWNQAQVATVSGQIAEAIAAGERALALAESLAQGELAARSRYVLSQAHSYAGRWDEVVTLAAAAHAGYAILAPSESPAATAHIWNGAVASSALQLQAMRASCLWQQAQGETHVGQPRQALAHAQEALALGLASRNEWVQVASQVNIAHAAAQLGLLAEARRAASDGLALARSLPNPAIRFWMLIAHNAALLAAGEYAAVAPAIAEAVLLADEASGTAIYHVAVLAQRCTLHMATGNTAAATADSLALAPLRAELATPLAFWDFSRQHEMAALLAGGHLAQARHASDELLAAAGANRRFRLVALRMAAALAQHEHQAAAARATLGEAAALAQAMELAGEVAEIGAMLQRLGE